MFNLGKIIYVGIEKSFFGIQMSGLPSESVNSFSGLGIFDRLRTA